MVPHLFYYQLVLIALVWLCVMLQWAWPSAPTTVYPMTPEPPGPRPKRHREPTPFAGSCASSVRVNTRGLPGNRYKIKILYGRAIMAS
jgi:hypothetical protein